MSRDRYVAAVTAGRNAAPGDVNPYAGQGILADLWRSGYNAMLDGLVASAAERRARQRETPRP